MTLDTQIQSAIRRVVDAGDAMARECGAARSLSAGLNTDWQNAKLELMGKLGPRSGGEESVEGGINVAVSLPGELLVVEVLRFIRSVQESMPKEVSTEAWERWMAATKPGHEMFLAALKWVGEVGR